MGWWEDLNRNLSDFGRSIDLTDPNSNLTKGTLAVTGTVYQIADAVALGALPNQLAGAQISQIGANNNIAANAAAAAGQLPVQLVLPTFQQVLPAAGEGLGSALERLLSGAGRGIGGGVSGIGKGLLVPILLATGVVIVVLVVASRTGTTQAAERVITRS